MRKTPAAGSYSKAAAMQPLARADDSEERLATIQRERAVRAEAEARRKAAEAKREADKAAATERDANILAQHKAHRAAATASARESLKKSAFPAPRDDLPGSCTAVTPLRCAHALDLQFTIRLMPVSFRH